MEKPINNTKIMSYLIPISSIAIIIIGGIVINNQIIAKKNQVSQAFGSIEIYLKKRFDLIPNLVSLLNKYLAHEKEVLLTTTELRSKINDAKTSQEKIEISSELTHIVSGLQVQEENYPNLKADA